MMKRAILYTLLGMCILSGCRNEDFEPTDVMPYRNKLTLSVCANDFVSADGMNTHTRASDDGKVTDFENGDRVGVIIMNQTGEIMANNLPYKFDGTGWNFDTGNDENKSAVYYDPLMYSYIVYYPYHSMADNCKSIDELKVLNAFAVQSDQSNEDAYRNSDLMVWLHDGGALKNINAVLTHTRASFSLAPVVKWQFANGSESSYAAPSLEDVVICDKDGKHLSPYKAEDGSYRYILPADYDGDIRWFYTYREKTFGGTRKVTGSTSNIRYSHKETMDMGEYSLDMAQVGDFYCAYEDNGIKHGYVLPQEAASVLSDHQCIGIVFFTGRHDKDDQSVYTEPLATGRPTLGNAVHGYVVALTDVHNDAEDRLTWEKGPGGAYDQRVGASTATDDWNGYYNCRKIHEFVTNNSGSDWKMMHFPAAHACETYGNRTLDAEGNPANDKYNWQKPFAAPSNTSGWFLPSCGQLKYLYDNRDFLSSQIRTVGDNTSSMEVKNYIKWFSTSWYYWSSSEDEYNSDYAWYVFFNYGYVDYDRKDDASDVRAVLAF